MISITLCIHPEELNAASRRALRRLLHHNHPGIAISDAWMITNEGAKNIKYLLTIER